MKFSKTFYGVPAIAVGLLIAATQYLNLPGYVQYVWAGLVLLWGLLALTSKK